MEKIGKIKKIIIVLHFRRPECSELPEIRQNLIPTFWDIFPLSLNWAKVGGDWKLGHHPQMFSRSSPTIWLVNENWPWKHLGLPTATIISLGRNQLLAPPHSNLCNCCCAAGYFDSRFYCFCRTAGGLKTIKFIETIDPRNCCCPFETRGIEAHCSFEPTGVL